MAFRMIMSLVILIALGGFFLWERRSPSIGSSERTMRIGVALAAVGAILSVLAWWMVFPLVLLLAGLVMIVVGRRGQTSLP